MTSDKALVKRPVGAPSTYDPKYCDMLIEHGRQGGSLESFAGTIMRSKQTVYDWMSAHPEFLDARRISISLLHVYYENMAKMLMTGRMQRLKREEPMLDGDGKLVINPTTGEPMMKREYESSTGSAASFIFTVKNLLGWRDNREISFDPDKPLTVRGRELSPEEKLKELREAMKVLREIDLDAEAIEITD